MTLLTKTVLFASLIALILPFSAMVEAMPPEKAPPEKITPEKANLIAKERSDRALRVDPAPALSEDIADKTPREKQPLDPERQKRLAANPPPPPGGLGHESFGTLLDKLTSDIFGIYSKNQVHETGITLSDNSYLYAPTTLAPNYSPWEIVTYYSNEGNGTEKKVVLFNWVTETYDWDSAHTIDSNFIDSYTLTFSGKDYYYAEIIKRSDNIWYAYLYNFDIPAWELWDSQTGSGQYTEGWVVWEEYDFWPFNCPTELPEISGKLIRVNYDGPIFWPFVNSTYASEHDTGDICGITSASFSSNYDDWSVDD